MARKAELVVVDLHREQVFVLCAVSGMAHEARHLRPSPNVVSMRVHEHGRHFDLHVAERVHACTRPLRECAVAIQAQLRRLAGDAQEYDVLERRTRLGQTVRRVTRTAGKFAVRQRQLVVHGHARGRGDTDPVPVIHPHAAA